MGIEPTNEAGIFTLKVCVETRASALGLCILFFGFICKGERGGGVGGGGKKQSCMHACRMQSALGEGIHQHPSRRPPLPPHRPERGGSARDGEEGWQARMEAEGRAKSLNVPQQRHRELRRGQAVVCAPACQFTGPKWHCWEESMFLS